MKQVNGTDLVMSVAARERAVLRLARKYGEVLAKTQKGDFPRMALIQAEVRLLTAAKALHGADQRREKRVPRDH